jgi:hypothetical protein
MSDDTQPTTNGNGKRKRGRPRKFVDLELVEKLAHIQCTHSEIACTLNVSVDTLWRHPRFAEVYKRGAEGGRKSLRRMQFESANKGNVIMQIFLGKVYLGQCDNPKEPRPLPLEDLDPKQLMQLIMRMPSEKLREALREFRSVIPGHYEVLDDEDVAPALPPARNGGNR